MLVITIDEAWSKSLNIRSIQSPYVVFIHLFLLPGFFVAFIDAESLDVSSWGASEVLWLSLGVSLLGGETQCISSNAASGLSTILFGS